MKLDFNNLTASRLLSQSSRSLSRALERLATGNRLNRFGDNLVSASQVVRLSSAMRGRLAENLALNQTQALAMVTDSALSQQTEILQKIRELTVQASNQTLSAADRQKISDQVLNLANELDRVAAEASFNGKNLLDYRPSSITQLVGNSSVQLQLQSTRLNSILEERQNNGQFLPTTTLSANADPLDYHHGDFNGDGRRDVIVIEGTRILSVLANGTDQPTVRTMASTQDVQEIAVGDVNGDGLDDLINISPVGLVYTYLSNGDGTFQAGITHSTTGFEIDVGDFNNDGLADLAVTSLNQVDILISQGNGSYTSSTINMVDDIATLAVGDINGDGNLDFMWGSANNDFAYSYEGDGSGSFTDTNEALNLTAPRKLSLADLDNDGLDDLIYEEDSTATGYRINMGDFTFGGGGDIGMNPTFTYDILDFNHDGFLDFIGSEGPGLTAYINNGGRGFTALESDLSAVSKLGTFFDANDDGVWDRVRTTASGVSLALGQAKTLTAISRISLNSSEDIEALLRSVDSALEIVNENQSKLAIFSNRLDLIREQNDKLNEVSEEARSRLQDIDYAQDLAIVTQEQIRQQAQIAALSQMQISWQVVLKLLQP
jgi:flagellin